MIHTCTRMRVHTHARLFRAELLRKHLALYWQMNRRHSLLREEDEGVRKTEGRDINHHTKLRGKKWILEKKSNNEERNEQYCIQTASPSPPDRQPYSLTSEPNRHTHQWPHSHYQTDLGCRWCLYSQFTESSWTQQPHYKEKVQLKPVTTNTKSPIWSFQFTSILPFSRQDLTL